MPVKFVSDLSFSRRSSQKSLKESFIFLVPCPAARVVNGFFVEEERFSLAFFMSESDCWLLCSVSSSFLSKMSQESGIMSKDAVRRRPLQDFTSRAHLSEKRMLR